MANSRKEYHRQYYLQHKERYAERQRNWRAKYPERALTSQYTWNRRNPEKVRATGKRWKCGNPDKVSAQAREQTLRKYGLSKVSYAALLASQNNVCAVCLRLERRKLYGKLRPLSIDHDHKTGKVRGLLCASCNVSLGMLSEDPLVISALLNYLQKHRD